MEDKKISVSGEKYIPYSERTGNESVVYFTRDLSEKGLIRIYEKVSASLSGKIAVKLHTGERGGPNIIPREWVKSLIREKLPDAKIVETNTYYKGDRFTTKDHLETLRVNGWDFCDVDILDADGTEMYPVNGGKWFKEMSVGKDLSDYDSLLVLTHFKGHVKGGFGGSNKNIGIGCADGKVGKKIIHTNSTVFDVSKEELMEKITESTKSVVDHFGKNITYINVLRNMSVSCDCEGKSAMPVVTPNIGIVASTDILAADQASVDLVYALPEKDHHDLCERIETRRGHRQLSYMKELGMGNDKYILIDLDNGEKRIYPEEAVKDVKPFVK